MGPEDHSVVVPLECIHSIKATLQGFSDLKKIPKLDMVDFFLIIRGETDTVSEKCLYFNMCMGDHKTKALFYYNGT